MNLIYSILSLIYFGSFFQPDLVSINVASVQAGPGMYTRHDWPFIAGVSFVEPSAYWGKYGAFFLSCEAVHGCLSIGRIEVVSGDKHFTTEWSPSILEFATTRIGFAILGNTKETLLSGCFRNGSGLKRYFTPRLEVSTALTPITSRSYSNPTFLSMRNEIRIMPENGISFRIEHRWQPAFNRDTTTLSHSFDVTFCLGVSDDVLQKDLK